MHSDLPRSKEPCSEQCPLLIRETLDLISAKWTVPIFLALHQAATPLRYSHLQRQLAAITPKELAKHLRLLETAGLIHREVDPTIPPRVEYSLTALGETLYPTMEGLADWAARFGELVAQNRTSNKKPAPRRLIKPIYKVSA